MKNQRWIMRTFGALLVISGVLMWHSRLHYAPETVLQTRFGDELISMNSDGVTDLSDICNRVSDDEWILFVLDTHLTNDSTFRTFFETAKEERLGLWIEYDPGLLRLGLGLGPDASDSNIELPIRWVRQDEAATIVVAVTAKETVVVANAMKAAINWPGPSNGTWNCDAVQIGSDTRELSQGHECERCESRLRYVSGEGLGEIKVLMDSLDNSERVTRLGFFASCLVVGGVFMALAAGRIRKRLTGKA